MTVKELVAKIGELKSQGKITDETHILSYNDEFDSLSEVDGIRFISDDVLFYKAEDVEADLNFYTNMAKTDKNSFTLYMIKEKTEQLERLDKLNGEWKNAIRII